MIYSFSWPQHPMDKRTIASSVTEQERVSYSSQPGLAQQRSLYVQPAVLLYKHDIYCQKVSTARRKWTQENWRPLRCSSCLEPAVRSPKGLLRYQLLFPLRSHTLCWLAVVYLGPAVPLFLAKGPLLGTVCHTHTAQESSKPSAGIMQQDAEGILSVVQSPSENWPWLNLHLLYRDHMQHLCLALSAKAKPFHTVVPFFCLYEWALHLPLLPGTPKCLSSDSFWPLNLPSSLIPLFPPSLRLWRMSLPGKQKPFALTPPNRPSLLIVLEDYWKQANTGPSQQSRFLSISPLALLVVHFDVQMQHWPLEGNGTWKRSFSGWLSDDCYHLKQINSEFTTSSDLELWIRRH